MLKGPAICAAGGFLLMWALECVIAIGTSLLIEPRTGWDYSMYIYWQVIFLMWMAPVGAFFIGLGLLYILRDSSTSS